MEDINPPPPLTDEQRCLNLHCLDKEVHIFTARKDSINEMLEIEKNILSATPETTRKLEEELKNLDAKIKTLEVETEDHHRKIPTYLTQQKMEYYVTKPPANRPLKLVIKGLPTDVDPEDIKNDLISKGIKIEKVTQLKKIRYKSLTPNLHDRGNS
ncbi:hypothetical protein TNCV_4336141 [Trichonephila clavipes]|nr:hypothetical protein TNCV_4336141 [Trichonephila clavipes]